MGITCPPPSFLQQIFLTHSPLSSLPVQGFCTNMTVQHGAVYGRGPTMQLEMALSLRKLKHYSSYFHGIIKYSHILYYVFKHTPALIAFLLFKVCSASGIQFYTLHIYYHI